MPAPVLPPQADPPCWHCGYDRAGLGERPRPECDRPYRPILMSERDFNARMVYLFLAFGGVMFGTCLHTLWLPHCAGSP